VVLLALLAAWRVSVLLLAPWMRWFLRRRINRMIERLNTRLSIELPSFKLTRRQTLIDRVFHDPKVQAAVAEHANAAGEPLPVVWRRVDRYVREIVPSFNAYLYFRVGYTVARAIARLLYRVRIGYADEDALQRITPRSTLVFVINHRSNMDYILVSFLAAERVTLSYAVGEWARVWGLQQLIRAMGAFFVRRNSGDELYRRVLERYIAMATEAGVPQAVFPEGGLSRDGRLREPRLGVLDYMLRGFRLDGDRDLVFVPLGLNYDRVLEDRTLLASLEGRKAGRLRTVSGTLGFTFHNLLLIVRSEWRRFGYACVNFGSPVSMRDYCSKRGIDFQKLTGDPRRQAMAALGTELMQAVGRVVPVVPVALISSVFRAHPEGAFSELELKAEVERLLERLQAAGARVYVPRGDLDYALTVGLRMLRLRHLVDEKDGLFSANPAENALLAYYANSIAHLL